jgi:hypothetical protein
MSDIDEIRRSNIRSLENELGSASIAAKTIGMNLAQYINLREGAKDSKSGKRRGMRKETAWKIEDGVGKPRGWLDIKHESGDDDAPPPDDQRFVSEVSAGLQERDIPDHMRQTIMMMLSTAPKKGIK